MFFYSSVFVFAIKVVLLFKCSFSCNKVVLLFKSSCICNKSCYFIQVFLYLQWKLFFYSSVLVFAIKVVLLFKCSCICNKSCFSINISYYSITNFWDCKCIRNFFFHHCSFSRKIQSQLKIRLNNSSNFNWWYYCTIIYDWYKNLKFKLLRLMSDICILSDWVFILQKFFFYRI